MFGKGQLQRAYRAVDTASLNPLSHDPSIFGVVQILGFVFGLTQKQDIKLGKDDIALLGKLSSVPDSLRSTSVLERIPVGMYSAINFVLTHDDHVVIYNLADLVKLGQDPGFYTKLYRHVMNLRLVGNQVVTSQIDVNSDSFDAMVTQLAGARPDIHEQPLAKPVDINVTTAPKTEEVNKPAIVAHAPIVPQTAKVQVHPVAVQQTTPPSFEQAVRQTVAVSQQHDGLDAKQLQKRETLLDNHFNVSFGGESLGSLIHNPPSTTVQPKRMDFLNSTPEESYKQASLTAMDKAYLQGAYKHEMAKVIGSLAKHGLYATKIDTTTLNTEMDRTITTKVSLTDITGKAHHVKFTLPQVDEDGLMMLSGIEYRLTRQIVNVPICKVSPSRVNLVSYYNKINVERITTKRNSYETDITKLLLRLRDEGAVTVVVGTMPPATVSVPYDYSAVGANFTQVTVKDLLFDFGGNSAHVGELSFRAQEKLAIWSQQYGTYVGRTTGEDHVLFWDKAEQIHKVDFDGKLIQSWASFHHVLEEQLGDAAVGKTPLEWTHANIINQTIPLVFILGYQFGLKAVFDMVGLKYRFYPSGTRAQTGTMDIAIKFADGTLVFNRYPLAPSFIAAGLAWVNLNDVVFRDLNMSDGYAQVLAKKDMSVGVLKGLRGFFDYFIDPITETVLEKMGEPTTFHGLLLRATDMLTDYHAEETSALSMHRFRRFERFNGMVYNKIFRGLANYRNAPNQRSGFSINPESVFLEVVQDATITPNDTINPVHEAKQNANFTFTGSGGRIARSFTPKDIVYPQDGIGVISESVPDSGKVGITSYLSASPRIDDIHGLATPYTPGDALEPPQILSIGSMLMPGGTSDDGKRNNYLSIQLSHYVPNQEEGETFSVRTGYDEVLPHIATETFASAAPDDGVVEKVDAKNKVVTVRYADTKMATLRDISTQVNWSGRPGSGVDTLGILVVASEIGLYPIGGVFGINRFTNGKVVDRLRVDNVEAIPDKDVLRKQAKLVQDFAKGVHSHLYYVRFKLLGTTTSGQIKSYSYTDQHTPISGAYVLQTRKANVQVGDKIKTGDIITYNDGFFVPDPMSKQVTFKHGVAAYVAVIEKPTNHEDACEMSRDFSTRLKMRPAHLKPVVTNAAAVVLKVAKVGDHVETSDSICVISDDYIIQGTYDESIETMDIMEKLSRQTPSAGYTGTIKSFRVLYGCDREALSDSLKTLLKGYEKEVREVYKALHTSGDLAMPDRPGWIAPGTKYKGIDITDDTVILEFMIEETLDMGEGDKLVLSNAAKSIVSYVNEKPHITESGIPIDILFSTTSFSNRILTSPFVVGIVERICDKLKQDVIKLYFK